MTYDLEKKCEYCDVRIPDDFGNMICLDCYPKVVAQIEKAREMAAETQKQQIAVNTDAATNPKKTESVETILKEVAETVEKVVNFKPASDEDFGIKDPNYKEHPEAEDKNQILANLAQFISSHDPETNKKGKMLWYPTRNMYNFIRNYSLSEIQRHPQYPKHIWKPDIVDVGCGAGVGSNVMSVEANMVWGLDKNKWSIEFAKECFERVKNNYYYSTQLTFDEVDIMTDNREFMKFDLVVAIEVIEHIYDTHTFLKQLITKFNKVSKKTGNVTEYFFSSPNRAHEKLQKDTPKNLYHVREWEASELVELLGRYFNDVKLLNQKGEPIPDNSEKDQIVLAHCKDVK